MKIENSGTYSIYKLIDPRNNETRYVGRSKDPQKRLSQHMQCREKSNLPKIEWLQELKKAGLKPLMEVIEIVKPSDSPAERETYWIDFYLQQGQVLLNRPNVIAEMWANMDWQTHMTTEANEEGYVDVRRLGK